MSNLPHGLEGHTAAAEMGVVKEAQGEQDARHAPGLKQTPPTDMHPCSYQFAQPPAPGTKEKPGYEHGTYQDTRGNPPRDKSHPHKHQQTVGIDREMMREGHDLEKRGHLEERVGNFLGIQRLVEHGEKTVKEGERLQGAAIGGSRE